MNYSGRLSPFDLMIHFAAFLFVYGTVHYALVQQLYYSRNQRRLVGSPDGRVSLVTNTNADSKVAR